MRFTTYIMWSSLSLLFLIYYTTTHDSDLMSPRALENTLASAATFHPDDLPWGTSGNQLKASGLASGSGSKPESQQIDFESSHLAGNEIGTCNRRAEHSDQTFPPGRSRRLLARFSKRGKPNFCSLEHTKQPVSSQESPSQAIPGNSKTVPVMGPGRRPEDLRLLLYSFPGTNGQSNEAVCRIDSEPLYRVPVCAPKYLETSPAALLNPSRFCKFEVVAPSPLPFLHPITHILQ